MKTNPTRQRILRIVFPLFFAFLLFLFILWVFRPLLGFFFVPLDRFAGRDFLPFWITIGMCVAAVAVVTALYLFIIPFFYFLFKKIYIYISLAFICARYHYRFRLTRFPFVSLGGIAQKGDVSITTDEGVLIIHFLDFLFPFRRALTVMDSEKYAVTPVEKGSLTKSGGALPGSAISGGLYPGTLMGKFRTCVFVTFGKAPLQGGKDKIKGLFSYEETEQTKHIVLITTFPHRLRYAENNNILPLTSGQTVGKIAFYGFGQLKKGLKKQLHCSLLDIDNNTDNIKKRG